MILQPLEPQDAEQIAELAADFYPEEMLYEAGDIASALATAVREGGNFSVGLVERGNLLAYMLAWLEESRVEGLRESVVLIDDLALATGEAEDLRLLLSHLVQRLEQADLTHLAIEGSLLPDTREMFWGLARFIGSLGYELVASQDYWEEEVGAELTWVRYERPAEAEVEVQVSVAEVWDGAEFPE
ncbi:MAG: hypothetical protein J0I12_00650 [Candidatus Eremiobacteraeota bacterium]|nr:hypothetical protein [Candidatus Eremiobacteraeota bacterium]